MRIEPTNKNDWNARELVIPALMIKGASLLLTLADKHKEQPSGLLISSA